MKKSYWQLSYLVMLLFVFLLLPGLLHAQPNPPDPPNPDCPPDMICPIDGGLVALIAVGVGYGVKKIRDPKKS
jgi:hypothetical protein